MPTAAKLFAALSFALVAFMALRAYIPLLPEGTQIGLAPWISAAIGAASGWFVMGPNTGRGMVRAIATGLRTGVVMLALALLFFGTVRMIEQSTRMFYKTPTEAVLDIFGQALKYAELMRDQYFLGVVAVGAALAGIVAEFAGRHWR